MYSVQPRRRDEPESESLSETHLSKKEVKDIKRKGKRSVKPRRRDEPDIISESSHLSKRVIDGTTEQLKNIIKEFRKSQEEEMKMKV